MMCVHRSTSGRLSRPLPFRSLARRNLNKCDAPVGHITCKCKDLPSVLINPSIARRPAWMLEFAPRIYRQPGNWPDGKSFPETQRDFFTVRFTVRLKGIPAIDLDRSRRLSRWTFANGINALGPFSIALDRPR